MSNYDRATLLVAYNVLLYKYGHSPGAPVMRGLKEMYERKDEDNRNE